MPATDRRGQGEGDDGGDRQRARGRLRALRRDAGVLSRIEVFAGQLARAGLAGALVMNPPDVYYLAGTGQPCNLLVTPGAEPVLFARRYLELARRAIARRAGDPRRRLLRRRARGAARGRAARHGARQAPGRARRPRAQARSRAARSSTAPPLLLAQRAVKDAGEIEAMRASVRLFDARARGDVRAHPARDRRARAGRRGGARAAARRPRRRRLPAPLGRQAADGGRDRLGGEPRRRSRAARSP